MASRSLLSIQDREREDWRIIFGVARGAASTPAPLEQHRERRRLKPKGSKINEGKTKRSNAEQGTGTDWGKVAPHECGPHWQRDHGRRILEERISKELEGVLGGGFR